MASTSGMHTQSLVAYKMKPKRLINKWPGICMYRLEFHICNEEKNQPNANKGKEDGMKANGVEVILNIFLKLLKTRKKHC